MAKDPVCGMEVDEGTAPDTTHFMQRIYYFCSAECKAEFERDPRKFVDQQGEIISHPSPPVTPEGDVFGLEQGGNRGMRPKVQAGVDQESKGAAGEWHGEGWAEQGPRETAGKGREGQAKRPILVKGEKVGLRDKKKPSKKFGT